MHIHSIETAEQTRERISPIQNKNKMTRVQCVGMPGGVCNVCNDVIKMVTVETANTMTRIINIKHTPSHHHEWLHDIESHWHLLCTLSTCISDYRRF
jgi:hypothetical protein